MEDSLKWQTVLKGWIHDLGFIATFLNEKYGRDAVEEYFASSWNWYRNYLLKAFDIDEDQPTQAELMEVLSVVAEFIGQAHTIDEVDGVVESIIVDCLPLKIIEKHRDQYHPDFPCKLWCSQFVKTISESFGYEGTVERTEEGVCLLRIKPKVQ